jgi:hypothetical protein
MQEKVELSRSIRKYIRREKSRWRREISDPVELNKKIVELQHRFGVKKN